MEKQGYNKYLSQQLHNHPNPIPWFYPVRIDWAGKLNMKQ